MNLNQQMYQQPYQNPYITPRTNGILWVQGIEGAKAWQMPANSNVMLLDSETEGRFYIKTSDNIGMCNLRVFEYKEITDKPASYNVDMSQYVTKKELKDAIAELSKRGDVNEQSVQSVKSKQKQLITE